MQFLKALGILLFATTLHTSQALATDCSHWEIGRAADTALPPLSVPTAQIGSYLSSMKITEGVQFKSWMKGDELWLDLTKYPSQASAVIAPRAVMQTGRLAGPGFSKLVLADQGKGVFTIDEPSLRAIGCQFVWSQHGGQNPIALIRMMFRSMHRYGSNQPLSNGFTGALLPDTSLALRLNNDVFMPEWAMSAVQ